MVLPSSFYPSDYNKLHYYQGVLVAEVAVTLLVYIALRIIHYIKWGYDEEMEKQGNGDKKNEPAADDDGTSKKWDQRAWDVYFPIIFAYHIGAISMIIVYIPYIFSAVIGFLHFTCFIALIILNICIKDAEPGNGSRTKGSRVVWGLMCLFNLMLIIGGLSGVEKVYP